MKTNILLSLMILLFIPITISCSNDDDGFILVKEGKVHFMGKKMDYEPTDVDDLPEWLLKAHPSLRKNEVYQILCKGIWKGKVTYLYHGGWMSYYPGASYFEDGTDARIDGKEFEEAGGWEAWTCIYFQSI